MPKILSIIPARGGSKGLPNKNILSLAGKPLIAWSIEASKASKYITKTVVSSDSKEILNIAKEYKADTINRPYFLALDDSSSESVVIHALDSVKENFDYIILLQPTSPLRDSSHIDKAFELLLKSDADALISVKEIDNKILKAFMEDEKGNLKGIANNTFAFMPRQKLPKTYMSNGAIYIIKTKTFLKNKSFFAKKTIKFLMDEVSSLDIDSKEDFDKVDKIMEQNLLLV